MSSRRLSLHPSALSDAEHALFTASLADLADVDVHDGTTDWERINVSVREARAWVCGRYPGLGAGRVDEMLHLFPAPTFGGGAFFALLRLVLHTQAGTPIDRSLAFVQDPAQLEPLPPPARAFPRGAPHTHLPRASYTEVLRVRIERHLLEYVFLRRIRPYAESEPRTRILPLLDGASDAEHRPFGPGAADAPPPSGVHTNSRKSYEHDTCAGESTTKTEQQQPLPRAAPPSAARVRLRRHASVLFHQIEFGVGAELRVHFPVELVLQLQR